jgi:glycosyl hydrolase family 20
MIEQANATKAKAPLVHCYDTRFILGKRLGLNKRKSIGLTVILLSMALAFLTLVSRNLLAPIIFATNPAPSVVPMLREWHGGNGSFLLNTDTQIVLDPQYADQLQATAHVFQRDLTAETGLAVPIVVAKNPGFGSFFLTLQTPDSSLGTEGYTFDVNNTVIINARTSTGAFYGTRTALQILQADPNHMHIPKGFARDYPQYQERGFMLDLGRKFLPLPLLEDYIRLMSWYKFNDLQLHFNDNVINGGDSSNWQQQYAAFRLNSPAFPGLAAADGSYTQAQIQELEQVASTYAVTITPEIDTPAHSLALTQYDPPLASPKYSKEFLDLSNPATYTFVDKLWNTFLPWFTTSQVHIGVDEYSANDADKYRTYINYYDRFLHQQDKTVRMWGSLSLIQSSVKVNTDIVLEDWDNHWANPVAMAHQGFQLINMNDNLLYIVPHAGYFHDFLDTRLLYDHWDPSIFDVHNPALNLSPDDPLLLGGMFAVWNDLLGSKISVQDITARIEPAFPVVGEKMWSGPTPKTSYAQFEQYVQQVGLAPNTHL